MAEEKKYEITEMELKMYIGLAMADTIPEGAARERREEESNREIICGYWFSAVCHARYDLG